MGARITCLCNDSSKAHKGVLLMKTNGETLKFKRGVLVREVVSSHADHVVIRCSSDQSMLQDSDELRTNCLYFLVPSEVAGYKDTYQKLLNIAALAGLVKGTTTRKTSKKMGISENEVATMDSDSDSETINGQIVLGQYLLVEPSYLNRKLSQWRPGLLTIPESLSPSPSVYSPQSSASTPAASTAIARPRCYPHDNRECAHATGTSTCVN